MKTLLLGMGNPILTDDAIGVRLASDFNRSIVQPFSRSTVQPFNRPRPSWLSEMDIVEECSVGGLNLIEVFQGYRRAIVLDSLMTREGVPGAWHQFTAAALRETTPQA